MVLALRRRGWLLPAAMMAFLLAEVAPAADAQDLAGVRERRAQIQERLDTAAQQLAEIEAQLADLEDEGTQIAAEMSRLEGAISEARDRISSRVRDLYKHGRMDPVMALFSGQEVDAALQRATTVRLLVKGDRADSEVAAAGRTRAQVLADRLAEQQARVAAALASHRNVLAGLERDLATATALEQRLEREARERAERARQARLAEERQRQAERDATVRSAGGYACPTARPHSFADTWGAPRSGGRRHRGTDILAPRGAHIYAVVGGTVDIRRPGRSAGNWLILRGVDGTHYYYMHLQGFAVGSGARVSAGQHIAYNGDTGNARGTPHLHFEQHPGGGAAINPYPLLRRIC